MLVMVYAFDHTLVLAFWEDRPGCYKAGISKVSM